MTEIRHLRHETIMSGWPCQATHRWLHAWIQGDRSLARQPPGKPATHKRSEMIMSTLLTDRPGPEPPWAGLHPSRTGLLNEVQKTVSALVARRLRRAEAELMALGDRCSTMLPSIAAKSDSLLRAQTACGRSAGRIV